MHHSRGVTYYSFVLKQQFKYSFVSLYLKLQWHKQFPLFISLRNKCDINTKEMTGTSGLAKLLLMIFTTFHTHLLHLNSFLSWSIPSNTIHFCFLMQDTPSLFMSGFIILLSSIKRRYIFPFLHFLSLALHSPQICSCFILIL